MCSELYGRTAQHVLVRASAECNDDVLSSTTDFGGEFDRTLTKTAVVHPFLESIEVDPRDVGDLGRHAAPPPLPTTTADTDEVVGLHVRLGGFIRRTLRVAR